MYVWCIYSLLLFATEYYIIYKEYYVEASLDDIYTQDAIVLLSPA